MVFKGLFPLLLVCTVVFQSIGQRAQDTTLVVNQNTPSTLKSKKIFYGEPGKAALYSLILPGAGQLYNKRWWKLPLVYALEGGALYFMLDQRKVFNKWNTCYTGLVEGSSTPLECGIVTDSSTAFRLRNGARNNRDLSYIFMGLAHILQVVDAFVDRHLINFDTSDDLALRFVDPMPFETQMTFLSISIPLNNHSTRTPSRKPTK